MTKSTQDTHHERQRRYRKIHETLAEPLRKPDPISTAPTRSLLREMCKRMLRHHGKALDRP